MWILCSVQVNVVKSDFNLHKKKNSASDLTWQI